MKLSFTVAILFFTTSFLFSQELQFGPIMGNPALRSQFLQQQRARDMRLEKLTGVHPRSLGMEKNGEDCPPELPPSLIFVESGDSLKVELDTFGLAVNTVPPTITLLNNPPLQFGTASYADSIITLIYVANPGLPGIVRDTARIQYQQAGIVDTILQIPILVKRKGGTVVADAVVIGPGDEVAYCLDDELDFPGNIACSQFFQCPDNYDGAGNEFRYFFNDTCIVYIASRFPGTDTVCIQICDDLAVCDVFKIPFTVVGDTFSLVTDGPFFDDFSTSNGPYPSRERWLDDHVYINSTFSDNAPSVGMATFDGLDKGGSPYNLSNGGVGDRLTSKPIDLSSFTANDDVYLRYFVSPKGYGQEPEEDPFYLEFRNKQGQWVGIDTIEGTGDIPLDSVPPFLFYAVKIDNPSFLHEAFQMRFSAASSPGGYGDWWHLDYVELKDKSTDVNNFSDFAFSTVPPTFLKNYTAIPLRHLRAQLDAEIKKTADGDIYQIKVSNRSVESPRNFADSQVNFSNLNTGAPLGSTFNVASGNEPLTNTLSHKDIDVNFPSGSRSDLISGLNALTGTGPFTLQTEFWMESNVAEDVRFRINDTVRTQTILADYFAHDDGSAELQFFWQQAQGGEETSVQYKANVADSLRGIQIMFPHFTFFDIEGQLFNLKVWLGDENGPYKDEEAVFELELIKPFFVDEIFDSLQAFTTYQLEDIFGTPTPLFIPANQYFYVGYEQLSATTLGIPIGYDLNHPCKCNFGKKTNTWINFNNTNSPKGALMIRPVFRPVVNSTNPTEEAGDLSKLLTLFPNPASSQLNVKMEIGRYEDFNYLIMNQLGQLVQQGNLAPTIPVQQLPDGTYYLQTVKKNSGEVTIQRFVVARR